MLANPSLFGNPDDPSDKGRPRGMAGFLEIKETGRDLYLFTTEGFRQACGGYDPEEVANELRRRGYLFGNDNNRLKSRHAIVELSRKKSYPRFYAVRSRLLEDDE